MKSSIFKATLGLICAAGLGSSLFASSSSSSEAYQGNWTTLTNPPPFVIETTEGPVPGGASFMWLLTDGSVIFLNQNQPGQGNSETWRLIPDEFGRYINGTWQQAATLPNGYSPAAQASAVLPDGRLIIMGGEYNLSPEGFTFLDQNMGAIYDPVRNVWTQVNPPNWFDLKGNIAGLFEALESPIPPSPSYIGDASSVVLPDGTFMLADAVSNKAALLDAKTLSWRPTGDNKYGNYHEEGWVLLPNGKVLTVDCYVGIDLPINPVRSELYDPKTGHWKRGADLVLPITNPIYVTGSGTYPYPDHEIGPMVLRPDGKVIAFGGAVTGYNAIYDSHKNKWSKGPTFPFIPGQGQLSCPDAPAALLPNGNVLVCSGVYNDNQGELPGLYFFELTYDKFELVPQPTIPNNDIDIASILSFVVLPTGQILETDETLDVEIYTSGNRHYRDEWAPEIKKSPDKVSRRKTYKIEGIRFNGMSQGAMYGDDYQSATNFPLVRIIHKETGHVKYCRTHDHSYMGVASDRHVHTYFDVPDDIESGHSKIEVVANGIPSKAKDIHVR